MGLLLHSLKLGIQKDSRVLDGMLDSFCLSNFGLLLDNICKDGVIDGQPIERIELLDQFQAHGASDSSVPISMTIYM